MSKVYFTKNISRITDLFDHAGLGKVVEENDLVALKIHFGEPGNNAYIKAKHVKPIVEKIKQLGGKPFLTDANTLYHGERDNSVEHIMAAQKNGYSSESMGCPIIIADGINSRFTVKVKINQKHFREVYLSGETHSADALIAIAHFKGHDVTGFGGAIKNIGMGLGTRAGKQQMHADVRPVINPQKCKGDGTCVKYCPTSAISMQNRLAVIDLSKCIGCAECVAMCRFNAISVSWAGSPDSVQEKMTEYAMGVIKPKNGKIAFINFIIDVSPNCDCYDYNDPPIVPDIGILASFDPVAIDQASVDLVNQTEGRIKSRNKFRALWPNVDWSVQLKHGDKIGLGSRKYELISL